MMCYYSVVFGAVHGCLAHIFHILYVLRLFFAIFSSFLLLRCMNHGIFFALLAFWKVHNESASFKRENVHRERKNSNNNQICGHRHIQLIEIIICIVINAFIRSHAYMCRAVAIEWRMRPQFERHACVINCIRLIYSPLHTRTSTYSLIDTMARKKRAQKFNRHSFISKDLHKCAQQASH